MRIFYDHQATSLQDAGGLSRYHYELARALARQSGLAIEYLLGWNASVMPFATLHGGNVKVLSWPTRMPPGYPRYAANALATTAYGLRHGRFDIYHSTYQRYEPAVRHRCLIATHHDSTQERYPHLFRNAKAIQHRKRRLYARADAVICISAASKADLLHFYGVQEERAFVIHHGFRPLAAPLAVVESPVPAEPYLLYVGSRTLYKNFTALLHAFARLPASEQITLVAAGGGPWSPQELALQQELGVAYRVRLIARAAEAQLAALYRGATMLVYPSLHEGFGFPPLEAMSEGCPVLASNTSSMPEICGDAAFYFEPVQDGHLDEVLARLLSDPAWRASKRAAGLERVGRYTWERTAEATLAVYQQALSRAR